MQLSYRVNPVHHVLNRALIHFSKRLSMTRHTERPGSKSMTDPVGAVFPGVALEDWDAMFTAVKARLTLAAQAHAATTSRAMPADSAQLDRLSATVLECVASLDQLHSTAREALTACGRLPG
jgi:hypothetical protein